MPQADYVPLAVPSARARLHRYRIFLASPNDVALERSAVRDIVAQLQGEYRIADHLALNLIAWDGPGAAVAMEAPRQPQESINRGLPSPADCDLFIGIFWSRIGSPDPVPEKKPDGTDYLSGSEWEYCNALAGFQAGGSPDIWLFRRRETPRIAINDPDRDELLAQWQKLEGFFAQFRTADGCHLGGVNRYQRAEDFRGVLEPMLRRHLLAAIDHLRHAQADAVGAASGRDGVGDDDQGARDAGVGADASDLLTARQQALSGRPAGLDLDLPDTSPAAALPPGIEPYPGLLAFTPEQASVFFGRGAEIDQLLTLLADRDSRFIAIVGMSGAGKSSMVAAGLLPKLRAGLIGAAPWLDLRCTPAERANNPLLGIAAAFKARLPADGDTEGALAAELRAHPERLAAAVQILLADAPEGAELLLFIDQFEELFTQVKPALVAPFVGLLAVAAGIPRLRTLVTLRADFYATACQQPGLARLLRRERGSFPLDPPGREALRSMIAGPARVAGLRLDDELTGCILDDALGSEGRAEGGSAGTGGRGTLALTAFALRELYRKGRASGRLSLADYNAIGGLDGAVARRAATTLSRLTSAQREALPRLFARLVEFNDEGVPTRRRAARADLDADLAALADELSADRARLLTGGMGAGDQPTVELAHETLLTAWPELADWVAENESGLRARKDLEHAAAEWQAAGRSGAALKGGAMLRRYRRAPASDRPEVAEYLRACSRRRRSRRIAASLGAALLGFGAVLYHHVSQSHYPPALAAHAFLVNLHLLPVPRPDLVAIEAGSFRMGDIAGDGYYDDELPVHPVTIAEPFHLGRYEVTFDEYDLFAAATRRPKPNDQGWGRGRRPVINVSWEDATAYAAWLARLTGEDYRLPSEAEWEYAARAGTAAARWWEETDPGAEPCRFANGQDRTFDRSGYWTETTKKAYASQGLWEPSPCEDGAVNTVEVGGYGANPWGLHDMIGNVWEWVADCSYAYPDAPRDGSAVTEGHGGTSKNCAARVLRGGAWNGEARDLRASVRNRDALSNRNNNLGFRLARSN
ncbi:MAG: SUMF1/EgtB/PvdO family nonheme iron enzyme [Thiohalocapsa sp.]|uniref:nSTAND1 domain-containing NTPase n=1 Tax=Thiohalocapsa sp. TaxID=2497641 RepID=UPI0025F9FF6E|nr:SUMF1/EgtB/PvdO family nonheme iron enzyme [Thiohalocapsa sp.]MCG6943503.1 SUMF1/EgtB/PvdO family nonheme iron enzyme [Thiohalocapsa sp.]